MTRRLVLALLVLASRALAEEPKSDRDRLIGTWKVLEFHDDGGDKLGRLTGTSTNPADKPERLPRLVFTKDEVYLLRPSKAGGVRDVNAGITNVAWRSAVLDEKAKTLEITQFLEDSTKKPLVYPGIYELNEKTLRICWNETPNLKKGVFPKEFKSDGEMNLLVCERLADEPEKPGERPITGK